MAKKLFVGNLPYTADENALKDLFSQAGTVVSSAVIMDKMTGRSKGFGFVEMSTDDEATSAINSLNGKDMDGRAITVNEARPMTERPPRQNGGGGGGWNRGGDRGGNALVIQNKNALRGVLFCIYFNHI